MSPPSGSRRPAPSGGYPGDDPLRVWRVGSPPDAVNIGAIAPLIGLTRGEWNEAPATAGQRLAIHVIFGVATAVATEAFASLQGVDPTSLLRAAK